MKNAAYSATPNFLSLLVFLSLLGMMPLPALGQPFAISADGSEVTDQKTGLIWRRCAEGLSWNGATCAGTPTTFTHEAALQYAAAQAVTTGLPWRLPNIKELVSITDRSSTNPAIDATAFPGTPASPFWSATPYVGVPTYAWYLSAYDGTVLGYYRVDSHYVRLVR